MTDIPDPFMARLFDMRQRLVAHAQTRGFKTATAQFVYPPYGDREDNKASIHLELWVNRPASYASPDHFAFPRCSIQEPDVLRELEEQARAWINSRPDPNEVRAFQALERVKAVAAEAHAAGLTYQSVADQLASHYPEPPEPEDTSVIERFIQPGPVTARPSYTPPDHGFGSQPVTLRDVSDLTQTSSLAAEIRAAGLSPLPPGVKPQEE